MERIDLALLIQIFKGLKSTLPRPAGFVNLRGAGQGKTCFLRGRAALFSAGRDGAERTSLPGWQCNSQSSDPGQSERKLWRNLIPFHSRQSLTQTRIWSGFILVKSGPLSNFDFPDDQCVQIKPTSKWQFNSWVQIQVYLWNLVPSPIPVSCLQPRYKTLRPLW